MLLSVQMISLPKLFKGKLDFFVPPCTPSHLNELCVYLVFILAVLEPFCLWVSFGSGCLEERKAWSPIENSILDVEL